MKLKNGRIHGRGFRPAAMVGYKARKRMSKKTTYTCDLECCSNEATNRDRSMQIIFTTEQTEGRSCEPYFELVNIDLCDNCLNKIIKARRYITGTGAQGHNRYVI